MKFEKTDLLKEKERLEKENKKLKKTIDKAIEYIEKRTKETDFDNDKLIDVLDILKGSDKE